MCAPGGDLMTTVKLPGGSCRKSIPCDTAYVRSYGSGIAHPYRERLVRRECNGGALRSDHAGQWTFAAGLLKAAGGDTCRIDSVCEGHTDRTATRRLSERGRRSRKHSQISVLAFTVVLTTTAARGEKFHNYQSENVLRQ